MQQATASHARAAANEVADKLSLFHFILFYCSPWWDFKADWSAEVGLSVRVHRNLGQMLSRLGIFGYDWWLPRERQ